MASAYERKNVDFHAHILKTAAESNEAVRLKMEKSYLDLRANEAALEASTARTRERLAAKQAELDAWERRRMDDDASLRNA